MFLLIFDTMNGYRVLLLCFVFFTFASVGQSTVKEKKEKYPSHFALVVRGLSLNNFSEQRFQSIPDDTVAASINHRNGFSFGGIIRQRYTDRLGIETGLIFNSRNYDFNTGLPDSNIAFSNRVSFTNFELPINGIVFIKLSNEWYSSAGLGVSIIYKPSSIASINEIRDNTLSLGGIANTKFDVAVNGKFGFEYRTEKKGYFYLGGSAQIPTVPLFILLSTYTVDGTNINNAKVLDIRAPFFSLDLKYFFPTIKNKGMQPLKGPIE